MSIGTKTCKTCGKQYKVCHTPRRKKNMFRWQDVACSPECGSEYFKAVLIARGQYTEPATIETTDIENQDIGAVDEDDEDCDEIDLDDYFD